MGGANAAGVCGFVAPKTVVSPLNTSARLFVTGNFHTAGGSNAVRDIAYVSTTAEGKPVLSIALSNGAGGFQPPAGPDNVTPLGAMPKLIAVGKFDGNETDDVAVIDLNPAENKPILRVFLSDSAGHFKRGEGASEFPLAIGEKPAAIVRGRFKNQNATVDDIAVISDTTVAGAARSGKITVFLNNGDGEFREKIETAVNFRPGYAAGSNNLRSGGKYDLILRDADRNRIAVQTNMGDGRFQSGALLDGVSLVDSVGRVSPILVGDLTSNNPLVTFDDIITFDPDRAVRVFENNGAEGFNRLGRVTILTTQFIAPDGVTPVNGNVPMEPYVVLNDFGDGKIGLAMLVKRENTVGIAVAKGDGKGSFVDPNFIPVNKVALAPMIIEHGISQATVSGSASVRAVAEKPFALLYDALISAQFTNGNKPDLALAVSLITNEIKPDVCATPFCLVQRRYAAVILFGNTCGGG
jgi:hypothetical protein